MNHLFVLGRESELSLAELSQVLRADQVSFEALAASPELAVFDLESFSAEQFARCGGLVKYAVGKTCGRKQLESAVQALFDSRIPSAGRLTFGISVYAVSPNVTRKTLNQFREQMYLLGMTMKSNLKAKGASCRFVAGEDDREPLTSVVVDKNNLVGEKGLEIVIGYSEGDCYVGATKAVQDFEDFGHRDMDRPRRDDVSGMLPPKLARMMINLAGVKLAPSTVLLDPFCGSGTIVQEALLMGVGKALGSDASDKAVQDATANIDWLRTQYAITGESRIEQVDVTDLATWLPEKFVDVAVTEPFLGDPVRHAIRRDDAIKRQAELSVLYDAALQSLAAVVKPGGRLVILFPVLDDRRIPLPPAMGRQWQVLQPWKDIFEGGSKRGGLDYQRPGQRVGREIFLLERKK